MPADAPRPSPEVLFVCVHNAGRSQMAAGLVRLRSEERIEVRSAGSDPADTINPVVVEAMAELGVDLSDEAPKPLTDDSLRGADVVVTMGCGDAARFIRENATRTGKWRIPLVAISRAPGESGTTSTAAFKRWSPSFSWAESDGLALARAHR